MKAVRNIKSGRGSAAFTLIELLVVIAIISLLVSILLPSLKKAKDIAKQTLCMSNERSIGLAMTMALEDTNGYYPQQTASNVGNSWYPLKENTWWGRVAQYLEFPEPYQVGPDAAKGTVGHCPSHEEDPGSFSYCTNWYLTDVQFPRQSAYAVKNPALKVLATEIHTFATWPTIYDQYTYGKSPFRTAGQRATHSTKINFLFCDGHVSSIEDDFDAPWTNEYDPNI